MALLAMVGPITRLRGTATPSTAAVLTAPPPASLPPQAETSAARRASPVRTVAVSAGLAQASAVVDTQGVAEASAASSGACARTHVPHPPPDGTHARRTHAHTHTPTFSLHRGRLAYLRGGAWVYVRDSRTNLRPEGVTSRRNPSTA